MQQEIKQCMLCETKGANLYDFGGVLLCPSCKIKQYNASAEYTLNITKIPWLEPDFIIDHIYLGGINSAKCLERMKEIGIAYILTAAYNCPPIFPKDFIYMNLDMDDSVEEDLNKFVDGSLKFINTAAENGKIILVHCLGGISRSASLVLYYVMKTYSVSFNAAFPLVDLRRNKICPNSSFKKCLIELSAPIIKQTMDEYISLGSLTETRKKNLSDYDSLMIGKCPCTHPLNKQKAQHLTISKIIRKDAPTVNSLAGFIKDAKSVNKEDTIKSICVRYYKQLMKEGKQNIIIYDNEDVGAVEQYIWVVETMEEVNNEKGNPIDLALIPTNLLIMGIIFGCYSYNLVK